MTHSSARQEDDTYWILQKRSQAKLKVVRDSQSCLALALCLLLVTEETSGVLPHLEREEPCKCLDFGCAYVFCNRIM